MRQRRRRSARRTGIHRARLPRLGRGLALAGVIVTSGVITDAASAARIPIPHFDGGDARLLLQDAERFTLTPTEGTTASQLRSELDNAGDSLRSQLRPEAEAAQATERSEIETRVAECADEAYGGAVDDVVAALGNGEEPDFDGFMYDRAKDCVGAAFPDLPLESIETAAAIMTANADEIAKPAFEQASTQIEPPGPIDDPPPDDSSSDGGISTWLLIGGIVVALGALAAYLNSRKPG